MPHATSRRRVVRVSLDGDVSSRTQRPDTLAVEEPLELRLGGSAPAVQPFTGTTPFTVTMRTPGHDVDLALGFLLAEGVIATSADVVSARHCPDAAVDADGLPTHNVVEVVLADGVAPPPATRHRHVSSACGICGTQSVDAVRGASRFDLADDDVRLDPAIVAGLPRTLRVGQRHFERTGGLHAAGLFTAAGELLCVREDVGRHNAVDKVVGWALQQGRLPLRSLVLQVSGRASFELVQKAWMAGCPALAAVSAPSSLAVDLATEAGMTLIGFSRETSFNVYAASERLNP